MHSEPVPRAQKRIGISEYFGSLRNILFRCAVSLFVACASFASVFAQDVSKPADSKSDELIQVLPLTRTSKQRTLCISENAALVVLLGDASCPSGFRSTTATEERWSAEVSVVFGNFGVMEPREWAWYHRARTSAERLGVYDSWDGNRAEGVRVGRPGMTSEMARPESVYTKSAIDARIGTLTDRLEKMEARHKCELRNVVKAIRNEQAETCPQ